MVSLLLLSPYFRGKSPSMTLKESWIVPVQKKWADFTRFLKVRV